MAKSDKKSNMTLDKLARVTQDQFLIVHKNMATKEDINIIRKEMATKVDLIEFKDDIIDEVRKENSKVIQSNDKVVTKLDILLKEESARTEQYRRQDKDILFLKQKVGV